jgi:hypothetical protein
MAGCSFLSALFRQGDTPVVERKLPREVAASRFISSLRKMFSLWLCGRFLCGSVAVFSVTL